MNYAVHFCRATGCQRQIPLRLLMCNDHWRAVPTRTQRQIYATLRATQRDPRDLAKARAYQVAVDEAVAAVATKQNNKLAARAAAGVDLFGPGENDSSPTHGINTRRTIGPA